MAHRVEQPANPNQQATARDQLRPVIVLEANRAPNPLAVLARVLGVIALLLLVALLALLVVLTTNLLAIGRVGDDFGSRARSAVLRSARAPIPPIPTKQTLPSSKAGWWHRERQGSSG